MEAVGSRLGRASSRYGGPSTTATAVFNGPVRKWKRKWVHVSSSPTLNTRNSSSISNNTGTTNSRLVLCRWTPLSAASSVVVDAIAVEEPPKRKFRYTPIVALEEDRRKAEKEAGDEIKARIVDEYSEWKASKNGRLDVDETKKEIQDSNIGQLDLGLCLKGQNSDQDSMEQNNDSGHVEKSNSGGLWKIG